MVLNLASVGCGNVGINPETDEKVGKESMTVEHFDSYLTTYVSKSDISVLVYVDISARLKQTYRTADAGLGEAHVLAYVDRAHVGIAFGKYIDCFEIHLARFLELHGYLFLAEAVFVVGYCVCDYFERNLA